MHWNAVVCGLCQLPQSLTPSDSPARLVFGATGAVTYLAAPPLGLPAVGVGAGSVASLAAAAPPLVGFVTGASSGSASVAAVAEELKRTTPAISASSSNDMPKIRSCNGPPPMSFPRVGAQQSKSLNLDSHHVALQAKRTSPAVSRLSTVTFIVFLAIFVATAFFLLSSSASSFTSSPTRFLFAKSLLATHAHTPLGASKNGCASKSRHAADIFPLPSRANGPYHVGSICYGSSQQQAMQLYQAEMKFEESQFLSRRHKTETADAPQDKTATRVRGAHPFPCNLFLTIKVMFTMALTALMASLPRVNPQILNAHGGVPWYSQTQGTQSIQSLCCFFLKNLFAPCAQTPSFAATCAIVSNSCSSSALAHPSSPGSSCDDELQLSLSLWHAEMKVAESHRQTLCQKTPSKAAALNTLTQGLQVDAISAFLVEASLKSSMKSSTRGVPLICYPLVWLSFVDLLETVSCCFLCLFAISNEIPIRYVPMLSLRTSLQHSRRSRLHSKQTSLRGFAVCAAFVACFLYFPHRVDGFGAVHSCYVEGNGALSCWGNNDFGQLGDGTTQRRSTPVRVSGLSSGVANVALGSYNSCILLISGAVKCWGRNEYGQLGDGTTTLRNTPVSLFSSGISFISVGGHGTGSQVCVVLNSGAVKCLGVNEFGQIGDGTTISKNTPTSVTGLSSGGVSVGAGTAHSCALLSSGAIFCWGSNGNGELGCGTANCGGSTCSCNFRCSTNDCSLIPKAVSGLSSGIASLHVGGSHSCVLLINGGVECWGDNAFGQLGDGTTNRRVSAASVSGLSGGVLSLALGGAHSCVVLSLGGVKCWGDNYRGKLGDWTSTTRTTPTDVLGLSNGAISVFLGGEHTCAVLSSGRIQCWGYNEHGGPLGDGTTTDRLQPVYVVGIFNFTFLSVLQVTSLSFIIASSDRIAGKSSVPVTFSFTTSVGGALAAGSTITLMYPSGFFASTGTPPGLLISGGGPTGTVATPTSTQIIITTATQAIAASTVVTVTLTGLTIGAATAGSSYSITVATSADQTASIGVSSGGIAASTAAVGSAFAQGTWSTAQLSVARGYFASASVGNVAIFGGGRTSCMFYTCTAML